MEIKSFFEETNGLTGKVTRTPVFTCAHCSKIVAVPDVNADRGFCLKCMYHTCIQCGGSDRCTPFEKEIEEHERRHRARERFISALSY